MNDSTIALAASTVVFIVSYFMHIVIRPRYVQADMPDGSRVLAKNKVTLYSALFGTIAGLVSIALAGLARTNRESKMQRMGML